MCRADNLATFMCRLFSNLGVSTSWKPLGLSGSVMGYLCLFTYLHLFGWHSLCQKSNSVYVRLSTSFTKSLPTILQVHAPKSSHNWFMTGHSACPKCHKDARIWQLQNFLPAAWITETGRDCPGLSILTANGLTLSLAKPNKLQNLQVSTASPGTKCYQITFAVIMLLWQVSTLRLNTP
jgi:hypothetical protein